MAINNHKRVFLMLKCAFILLIIVGCSKTGDNNMPINKTIQKSVHAKYSTIPRNIGLLRLNMANKEFQKLTGKYPERNNDTNINEKYASLTNDQMLKIGATRNVEDGAEVYFYKDHVYEIVISADKMKFYDAIGKYNQLYGPYNDTIDINPEVISIKWSDGKTIFRIDYGKNTLSTFATHIIDESLYSKLRSE